MSVYCPKCGTRNLRRALVCEKCGTQLVSGPITPDPYQPTQQQYAPPAKERSYLGIVPRSATGMIIGLVMMVIGIVLIIYSFSQFVGSAEGAADDPFDTVSDILGAFVIMIVAAFLTAFGGLIFTIGMIWFFVRMLGHRD